MPDQIIHPPTAASLATLASIQGDDRCILTVYFPGSLTTGPNADEKLAELPAGLIKAEGLTADEVEHALRIAADICVYTNRDIPVEELK